jgi:hypothetical protein
MNTIQDFIKANHITADVHWAADNPNMLSSLSNADHWRVVLQEDWCADYGYDTDSRKAEARYKTIQRQSAKLLKFLGNAAASDLLWNTERL